MNTLTHVGNLFAFIGGLGMFLYGMDIRKKRKNLG